MSCDLLSNQSLGGRSDICHQFWSCLKVPVGMGDIHMSKVRCQCHEMSSNIFASCRALFQRSGCECVANIMNSTRACPRLIDPSMQSQPAKCVFRHLRADAPHPRRKEQMII